MPLIFPSSLSFASRSAGPSFLPSMATGSPFSNVMVITARHANPLALVRSKHVLLTKAAVAKLEEILK